MNELTAELGLSFSRYAQEQLFWKNIPPTDRTVSPEFFGCCAILRL